MGLVADRTRDQRLIFHSKADYAGHFSGTRTMNPQMRADPRAAEVASPTFLGGEWRGVLAQYCGRTPKKGFTLSVARIALTIAIAVTICAAAIASAGGQSLTAADAQQQLRAFKGLPVPAAAVKVPDVTVVDGAQVATADFAGSQAHVKFQRFAKGWMPAEMAYEQGWVPLPKGFTILTGIDESGIQSVLRAIASAQLTYAAVCGDFFYAPTLAALAKPQPGQSDGFILNDMVPKAGAAWLEKYNYRVAMAATPSPKSARSCNGVPAGQSAQTWSATARRLPKFAGKSYKIDAEGRLSEM